jgi:hypothetical protein
MMKLVVTCDPGPRCPNCYWSLRPEGACKLLCLRCGLLLGCSEGQGGW